MKDPTQMELIGQRVKRLRESLGMSQESLAFAVGYQSRSSINKIELGKTDLSQSRIIELATALNTTPRYLLDGDDEKAIPGIEDDLDAEFIDLFLQLTDAERSLIIAQIKGILANR